MTAKEDCTRTHEPSLRELTAQHDALKELMLARFSALEDRMDERDRLYKERDDARRTAVDAAFAAQKEAINLALSSSDRAVLKAENATERRFEAVNEFRGALDNQQRTLIARSEVGVLVDGINEKISMLTKQQDALILQQNTMSAEHLGVRGGWGYAVGAIGLLLAVVAFVVQALR